MKDSTNAAVGRTVRSVFSGETEEEAARRKAGQGRREERFSTLGFTEHRWTEPFAYAICETCRAWLSTDEDDLATHRAFHDQLETSAQ